MADDPFALVRAYNRMKTAGYTLTLSDQNLLVQSDFELSEKQADFITNHKVALVQLLTDAEALASALEQAGTAGLGWCEGTPPEWTPAYLTAVGEILYSQRRMANRLGRRYSVAVAPPMADTPAAPFVAEIESCAATMALSIDVEAYLERAA